VPTTLSRFWGPRQLVPKIASVDPSELPFANLSARSPSFQIRLNSSGKLPQNQPCAITGSVTFTPAVKTLSRI